ncbi:tRNA pseudouridine(38-40) synthase TruA [Clostridium sediminicola]|uniref:tRNA pseudouridine(38-40) synthase TruA n=1 Tax=Clostridium sediminicola TaxID=3114879 RepID=UPI003D164993
MLVIEYDGTNYAGWQRQINANTVQETLEKAIYKVTGEVINLIGCSRTDTGVHAKEYVANFRTNSSIPGDRIKYAINNKLPSDIVVLRSKEVSLDFHARYSSKGKKYIYTINNRKDNVAINRNYIYHYRYELDVDLMKDAIKHFCGTHDFSAFRNKGSQVTKTVKTIYEINVDRQGEQVIISVNGDGFLYNMVRIMVGTLIDVGRKRVKPDRIKYILNSKDRKFASKTAPASGLCLEKVFY